MTLKEAWFNTIESYNNNNKIHNLNTIKEFLSDGFDINTPDDREFNEGSSALLYACCDSNYDLVKFLLLNGADVNMPDNYMNTPLNVSVVRFNMKIIKMLVKNGADVNFYDADDEDESTPLILISKNSGYNPLTGMIYNDFDKRIEIFRYLLESGANIKLGNYDLIQDVYLSDKESQELICELQPENISVIKDFALPEIKKKYRHLFVAESTGLL